MRSDKVVAGLLFFAVASCVELWAQEDYDTYEPMIYTPLEYVPKSTGAPLKIQPYRAKQVDPTVKNLRSFLSKSRWYPGVSDQFRGEVSAYERLAISYAYSETKNIGKKKQMKYFQDDWNTLHHFIFKKDSLKRAEEKNLCVLDSISARQKFVQDSTLAGDCFYLDSIDFREKFVEDSLYRADYRKTHKYDYVVFDGPHGRPLLCYRKGVLIDGAINNQYGLVEKEYKGGKLIHDYYYSRDYLSIFLKKPVNVNSFTFDVYVDDKVEKSRTFYDVYRPLDQITLNNNGISHKEFYNTSGAVIKRVKYMVGRIDLEEYYNAAGVITKRVEYKKGKIDHEEAYLSYYPDNKTIKTKKVTYYDDSAINSRGNVDMFDYFSDGSVKMAKRYRIVQGKLVIKEIWTRHDGYYDVEHYDFSGNLERRSTEYLSYL